jgi:ubiquinone/menaquinone biosynthesis C-methylase UbiE/uncharacterized protein YbaR (Trm112 family)
MLNPELLSLLCHPHTHEPLQVVEGRLVAAQRGDVFPVREGIPRLIGSQAPLRHRFWEWVYNRVAFAYDWGVAMAWQWKLGGQPIHRHTYLEKIQLQPGELVLETAIGTGANLEQLPDHARFVGLDISYNMLRQCARNLEKWGRKAFLVQGDAQKLPFYDQVFDAVYHMGGLQFLANPFRALVEALRVTKPGGRLWIVDEAYSIPSVVRSLLAQQRTVASRPFNPKRPEVEALISLLPTTAEDIHAELISNGELYLLSFNKCKDQVQG